MSQLILKLIVAEYLYLLMSKIRGGDGTIILFDGQPLAQSFLHGGYPFVGMSQAAVHYLITDDIDESTVYIFCQSNTYLILKSELFLKR